MKVSGNSDSVVGFLREFSAYVHSHLVGVYNLDLMVSCILSGHPLLLLGDTGTGKSRFSRLVASGLFGKSIIKTIQCAYFDITDIAGVLPHNENNRIKYDTKDKNSIWQADVLHLEELTRAPPEQQSNYLALLDESKSLFNQKLKYKAVIATANFSDDSYSGTYELDPAFNDRIGLAMPLINDLSSDDLVEILGKSLGPSRNFSHFELDLVSEFITLRCKILTKTTVSFIKRFISVFSAKVNNDLESISDDQWEEKSAFKVSPRTLIKTFEISLSYIALKVALKNKKLGKDFICNHLETVLRFAVLTKLKIPQRIFDGALKLARKENFKVDALYPLSRGKLQDKISALSKLNLGELTVKEKGNLTIYLGSITRELLDSKSCVDASEYFDLLEKKGLCRELKDARALFLSSNLKKITETPEKNWVEILN